MHGIYNLDNDFFLLFHMHRCIYYFSSQTPSKEDMDTCQQVVFTSKKLWDLYAQLFAKQEWAYNDHPDTSMCSEHFATDGDDVCTQTIDGTSSKDCQTTVDSSMLAHCWGASIPTADQTLACTTTRAVWFYPQDEFTWSLMNMTGTALFPSFVPPVVLRYAGSGCQVNKSEWIWTTVL